MSQLFWFSCQYLPNDWLEKTPLTETKVIANIGTLYSSPLPWTVPTGAENAFIYLTVSAGPSDFLFLGADYK